MSYNNGKITLPIDVSDPYYVLGVGSLNGKFDVGHICGIAVKDKINILSRRKPVKYPAIFTEGIDDWYKAANGNFGILLPTSGSSSALPAIGQPMERWGFDYPTGGTSELFRLNDYVGYNHNAPTIFSMHPDPAVYPNAEFRCSMLLKQNAEISINEINFIRTAYIGCIIRHQASGQLRFRTLNRSVMEMMSQEYVVTLNVPNWADGKIDVYMVAAMAEASEQSYDSVNTTIYSLNQSHLETAHEVRTLAKPEPNSFKFSYKVVNEFANEYHLECTFTSIKGAWEKARFSVMLESEPLGAFLGGMGESLSPAPIGEMLSQGESYTFNSQSFTRVQTSQNNYVNYTARYLGDNYQAGSILFRAK